MSAQAIVQILEGLGKTADEVAAALRNLHVHGVRNTLRFLNPVVRTVQVELNDRASRMDVTGGVLHVVHNDGTSEAVPLSPAVLAFLAAFDGGAYPDLECDTVVHEPRQTQIAPPKRSQ